MIKYRMSPGNRIMYYIFGVVFPGMAAALTYMAVTGAQAAPLLFLAIPLAALGWFFFQVAARQSVLIDDQSLTVTNTLNSRSALLDEIEGFRSGQKNALLLDLKSGGRPLTIPGTIERRQELLDWVKERYPNIDARRAQEVTEEVLQDQRYGLTEEEREMRLQQARNIAKYATAAASFFVLWVVMAPRPFNLLMLILLAVPLAAVGLTWYYKGLLRLYFSKSKPYPSLIMAVIFADVAAFMAILHYHIYLYEQPLWTLLLAVTAAVTLVWVMACSRAAAGEKNSFVLYLGLLLIAAVYSYNALLFTNCAYDKNKPETWTVGVDGKHRSSGKYTTYWIDLTPWGRFTDGMDVKVSDAFYHSVSSGDSVTIELHPGKWGIPWYEVAEDRN